jgi:hypothetical protein
MSCDPSVRRGDWYIQPVWIPTLRQANVGTGLAAISADITWTMAAGGR